MSGPDEIRDAFNQLADTDPIAVGSTLDALRPRMRRRRIARTTAGALPLVALAVISVGLVRGNAADPNPPDTTIIADDGGITTPPSPEADPDPDPDNGLEREATPTPTPQPEATSETTVEPDPAPVQTAEPVDPQEATSVPPSTPSTTPEPAVTETAAPAATATPATAPPEPTPLPTPDPEPTETPTPTPVESTTTTVPSTGGSVVVTHTSQRIISVVPSPSAGYTSEIDDIEATEAKVTFTDGEIEIEIEIHLEGGELTWETGD